MIFLHHLELESDSEPGVTVLGLVVRQQRQFPAFPVRYTEFKRRELRRLDVNLERVRVILVRDQIVPVWGCRKLRPNIGTFQLIP